MMTVHIPIAKLSDLALMGFVLHLKDLCDLNRPTQLIEDYIEERVPPHIANEYTDALLKVMTKLKKRHDFGMKCETMKAAETLVHSATTELKSQFWKYSCSRKMLKKLKNLQILSTYEFGLLESSHNGVGRFRELREFTYFYCTDELLRELATNCTNLQKLDTGWTSSEISDESVNSIIQFTKLTYLIIYNATFSTQGMSDLLSGLSNRKIITFLAIPLKTEDHFSELPETITQLHLFKNHYCKLELSSLSRLKNLKSLTLRSFDFDEVKHLLLDIGCQLQKLGLGTSDQDLNFVAEACPFLQVLELYHVSNKSRECPNFKSVTSCIFHNPYLKAVEDIVSKCPHVQNVVFYDRKYTYELHEFLKKKQIGQNEMYIGCEDDSGKFTGRMKVTVVNEIIVESIGSSQLSDYFKDFLTVFRQCTSRGAGYWVYV